jgi:ribonuclease D
VAALWIDRPDGLTAAVERWRAAAGPVALDTEFVFERTYRPRLGIIQVAAAGEIALGRLEWALADSATLATADGDTPDPAAAWRRVKGIDRLPAAARAVARALAAWREREADRLDLARPFLLKDETLIALARREALAMSDVAGLPGYDGRRHAAYGPQWIKALAAAREAANSGAAPPEDPRPSAEVRERREALEDKIGALVTRRATELGLSPELLLTRRQRDRALDAWTANGGSLAEALGGFRGALLGAELDALGNEP